MRVVTVAVPDALQFAIQRSSGDAITMQALEEADGPVAADVVVIGCSVKAPTQMAQGFWRLNPRVQVILLEPVGGEGTMQAAVTASPFLGRETRCITEAEPDALAAAVGHAVLTSDRRQRASAMAQFAMASLGRAESPKQNATLVLDRLLEMAPVGVAVVQEDGSVVAWNRTAATIVGTCERDAVGKRLTDVMGSDQIPAASVEAHAVEVGDRCLLVWASPLETEDLGSCMMYAFLDDTDRVRAQQQLKKTSDSFEERVHQRTVSLHEANEELQREEQQRKKQEEIRVQTLRREQELKHLQELDRFKTDFINSTAHELSTPLTPIRLQLAVLRQLLGDADPKQRKSLQILDRNFERLSHLVGEVLEVVRLQAKRLGLQKQDVDLMQVAQDVVDMYEPQADSREIRLGLHGPKTMRFEADPERLQQVLHNLISNALKFTPRGGQVDMHLKVRSDGARIDVQDTGVGLTKEQMDSLFEPFSQMHEVLHPGEGGTGLGLHISKGLVELHGGRLWCDSEGADRGSTFHVSLPGGPG